MSDLDLLVRPDDLERTERLLGGLGFWNVTALPSYANDPHLDPGSREHVWETGRDGLRITVEFRAQALQATISRLADLDPALRSALRTHAAAFWQRAVSDGDQGHRSSPEDLLLHVTGHLAAQHAEFRLIWLRDIACIVERHASTLDWDYFSASAADLRIETPVWAALRAASRWIGAEVPSSVLDRLQKDGVAWHGWERREFDRHTATLGDADLTRDGFALWPFGAALGRMQGWRPRLRAIRWALLPSREYFARHGAPVTGLRGYVREWTRRGTGFAGQLLGLRSRRE